MAGAEAGSWLIAITVGFGRMVRVWGSIWVMMLLIIREDLTTAQRLKWEIYSSSVRPSFPTFFFTLVSQIRYIGRYEVMNIRSKSRPVQAPAYTLDGINAAIFSTFIIEQ